MKWFKHYNNASQGQTLRLLWDQGDLEAYGLFWRLLELMSQFEKPDARGQMKISLNTIARDTGWKPSKSLRVLARIVSVSQIQMTENQDGTLTFLIPNWLELQENRGRKIGKKMDKKAGEERSKKKEERISTITNVIVSTEPKTVQVAKPTVEFKIADNLSVKIPQDVIKAWSDTYPEDFLREEMKKARNWLLVNPHKRPKTAYTRFFNAWLGRGWENYRKSLKSNPSAISEDSIKTLLEGL